MPYRWIVLGTCCLISLYVSGTLYIGFTSFIEPLAGEFGWSYTQISFAASLRGLEVGLLAPVAGMILDRWGPQRLIFGGVLLAGIGWMMLSRVDGIIMFYACFIFLAFGGSAAANSLLMAIVSLWFKKNAGLAMGVAASGVAFGGLLLPAITGIVDTFGWRRAALAIGVVMWILLLPLSFLLGRKPSEASVHTVEGDPATSHRVRAANTPKKTSPSSLSLLARGPFWIMAGAFLCHILTVNAIMTHIMPYLATINFSRTRASFIASSLPLLTIVGRLGFGWLADHFNNRNVAASAFALTCIAAIVLSFVTPQRLWMTALFAIILGVGWGGAVPMASCLVITYFGRAGIGSILGLMSGFGALGGVVGAPLAGWFFDHTGDYTPAWYVISAVMGAATIAFRWLLPASAGQGGSDRTTE